MRIPVLLVAGLSFVAPAFAAEGQPEGSAPAAPSQERTKVFVGAGLGGGFGAKYKVNGTSVTFDDRLQGTTDKTPLVAVNVASFGIAMAPGLFAGLDLAGFGQSGTALNGDKTSLTITNYFAALTYFPWESGLFIRAGAGLSSFVLKAGSTTDHASGLGFLVAGGYALQLSGAHHLSLTVEQTWQSYGGSSLTKPDSSQIGAVFLGYMWKP